MVIRFLFVIFLFNSFTWAEAQALEKFKVNLCSVNGLQELPSSICVGELTQVENGKNIIHQAMKIENPGEDKFYLLENKDVFENSKYKTNNSDVYDLNKKLIGSLNIKYLKSSTLLKPILVTAKIPDGDFQGKVEISMDSLSTGNSSPDSLQAKLYNIIMSYESKIAGYKIISDTINIKDKNIELICGKKTALDITPLNQGGLYFCDLYGGGSLSRLSSEPDSVQSIIYKSLQLAFSDGNKDIKGDIGMLLGMSDKFSAIKLVCTDSSGDVSQPFFACNLN